MDFPALRTIPFSQEYTRLQRVSPYWHMNRLARADSMLASWLAYDHRGDSAAAGRAGIANVGSRHTSGRRRVRLMSIARSHSEL